MKIPQVNLATVKLNLKKKNHKKERCLQYVYFFANP